MSGGRGACGGVERAAQHWEAPLEAPLEAPRSCGSVVGREREEHALRCDGLCWSVIGSVPHGCMGSATAVRTALAYLGMWLGTARGRTVPAA